MNKFFTLFVLFASVLSFAGCDTKTRNVNACGDGFIDPGEECDVTLGEASCASLGHYRIIGTLGCNSNCTFDRSDCGGRCGDGAADDDEGEDCDGLDLNNNSCASLGFGGGELACGADCRFDTSDCLRICGNGYLEGDEGCDDRNTTNGDGCSDACEVEAGWECTAGHDSVCTPICGDEQALGDEDCDDIDLRGQTCDLLGYHGGALACAVDCTWELASCEAEGRCGDGVVQSAYGEACDGADPGASTCLDLDLFFGAPDCDATCALTTGTCRVADLWGASGDLYTIGFAIARDAAGNLYVAGNTHGALPGQTHAGMSDAFLRKYSATGEHLWTRQWGSTADETAWDLAVAPSGDVLVTGTANGALEGQTHAGGADIFLVKFNPAGDRQWLQQWGTTETDEGLGVAVDAAGNAYVTGGTRGALEGQTVIGGQDAFLTQVSSSGTRGWTVLSGTSDYDDVGNAVTWSNGYLFVTGNGNYYNRGFLKKFTEAGVNTLDFQVGNSNCIPQAVAIGSSGEIYLAGWTSSNMADQTHKGNGDNFLARYSAAGTHQWSRLWGTLRTDQCTDIALDAAGNILATGFTDTSLDLLDGQMGLGPNDIFLTRFTPDGTKLGTRLFGTAQSDTARGIVLDAAGHAYLTGFTRGAMDGQPLTGTADAFLLFVP
jgi:cysteine-rich repeat protein